MRTHLAALLAGVVLVPACGDDIGPSNAAPAAAFTSQCTLLSCTFTDGSTDSDGTIEEYRWTFGDGATPVTTRHAAHTYASAGSFDVSLTVTDDDGATTTGTETIGVTTPAGPPPPSTNAPPAAGFTASCDRLACTFIDRSFDPTNGGQVVAYDWDFGDNSVHGATRDAAHVYAASGEYTVRLTVRDNEGATGTATRLMEPNLPPQASFLASCVDLTCEFTDRSVDVGGAVVAHRWDFGDSETSDAAQPTHIYRTRGTYTVALTVSDAQGASDSDAREFFILDPDITAECVGQTCVFTPDTQEWAEVISWDFGDGSGSDEHSPTHVYDVVEPSQFTVTLFVTDMNFQNHRGTLIVNVGPATAR